MIRIGIYGYGNLGKGVELAIAQNPDTIAVGVFTRRSPDSIKTLTGIPVYASNDVLAWKDKIDVMILCGGSATDLPTQTPFLAEHFNVVDSFDTHAKIPQHAAAVDAVAKAAKNTALISGGWDPGMFSLARLYASAVLSEGQDYTFWGKGVSQGHSDAVRRIEGVVDARQYTIPIDGALASVRKGETPALTTAEKHEREVFVVAADGADKGRIEREIKTMPAYFEPYDTTVHFISLQELKRAHSGIPHGGFVLRSGVTGLNGETRQMIEYRLTLGSNPEFTSSVLLACARAVVRMDKAGMHGCKTIFDVPPAWLSPEDGAELRKNLL